MARLVIFALFVILLGLLFGAGVLQISPASGVKVYAREAPNLSTSLLWSTGGFTQTVTATFAPTVDVERFTGVSVVLDGNGIYRLAFTLTCGGELRARGDVGSVDINPSPRWYTLTSSVLSVGLVAKGTVCTVDLSGSDTPTHQGYANLRWWCASSPCGPNSYLMDVWGEQPAAPSGGEPPPPPPPSPAGSGDTGPPPAPPTPPGESFPFVMVLAVGLLVLGIVLLILRLVL